MNDVAAAVAVAIALVAVEQEQRQAVVTPAVETAVSQVGLVEPGRGILPIAPSAPAPALPKVLVFTAKRCGPCRTQAAETPKLEMLGYDVRTIDIDQFPRLQRGWKVTVVPTVVLADVGEDGKWRERARNDGLTLADEVLHMTDRRR